MGGVLPVTVIRSMEPRASDKSTFLAAEVSVPPARDGAGGRDTGDRSSGGELATEGNHPSMPPQPSPPPPASLVQLPPRMLHPRRVKTAVLVAAGLSTRMFPASAVVKKELFPIVDHDGVCKPVILAIMEGLVESGIERFVVVVQQKDIAVFDEFFSMKAVEKHKHRRVLRVVVAVVFWSESPSVCVCGCGMFSNDIRYRTLYVLQLHVRGFVKHTPLRRVARLLLLLGVFSSCYASG